MKCRSCDVFLTDFESTRKSMTTGEYFDLCNSCFSSIRDHVFAIERYDLEHDEVLDNHPIDREV